MTTREEKIEHLRGITGRYLPWVADQLPKNWPNGKNVNHKVLWKEVGIKCCTGCREWKPTSDFYPRRQEGGYLGRCKPCQNEYMMGRHEAHKVTKVCPWCDHEFRTRKSEQGTYCSNACQNAYQLYKDGKNTCRVKWPEFAKCPECRTRFEKKNPHHKYCSERCPDRVHSRSKIRFTSCRCFWCGTWFVGDRQAFFNTGGGRSFCSDLCSKKCSQAGRRQFWIARWRRIAIYERDNYTCQICFQPVEPTEPGDWHPLMPTLDHIVHQSKGGDHSDDNLRTAHAICNSMRSDNEDVPDGYDVGSWVEDWLSQTELSTA